MFCSLKRSFVFSSSRFLSFLIVIVFLMMMIVSETHHGSSRNLWTRHYVPNCTNLPRLENVAHLFTETFFTRRNCVNYHPDIFSSEKKHRWAEDVYQTVNNRHNEKMYIRQHHYHNKLDPFESQKKDYTYDKTIGKADFENLLRTVARECKLTNNHKKKRCVWVHRPDRPIVEADFLGTNCDKIGPEFFRSSSQCRILQRLNLYKVVVMASGAENIYGYLLKGPTSFIFETGREEFFDYFSQYSLNVIRIPNCKTVWVNTTKEECQLIVETGVHDPYYQCRGIMFRSADSKTIKGHFT